MSDLCYNALKKIAYLEKCFFFQNALITFWTNSTHFEKKKIISKWVNIVDILTHVGKKNCAGFGRNKLSQQQTGEIVK